jgi:hypothetical protein
MTSHPPKEPRPLSENLDHLKTEDEMQREQLGPRGVPGEPDPARMTPQQKKNMPLDPDDGHTA